MRRLVAGWMCVLVVAGCAARQGRVGPPAPSGGEAPPAATVADRRAAFAAAQRALDAGDFARARSGFAALLPRYPEMTDYCLAGLARSAAGSGDRAAAATYWQQLLEQQPESLHTPRAQLELARLLRAGGDTDAAVALLDRARQAHDQDVALAALLELADIEMARGDDAAADVDLSAARRAAPGAPLARQAKQRQLALRQRDPRLEPSGAALEAELHLLMQERDFSAARAAADRLLATAPRTERPAILRLRADAEQGAGELELSLASLQEIVAQYPASPAAPEAQFRYATLLWNRDRNREAAQAYEDLRVHYPQHPRIPEALYALARIEQGEGNDEAAIALYTQLADTYPSNALAHEARWRVGWIRYRQERWSAAAAAFATAAAGREVAAAADASYWQARALERAGDSAAAATIYRRITDGAPASYYAGWAARRLGEEPDPTSIPVAAPQPAPLGAAPPGTDPYHWLRARELQGAVLPAAARRELRVFERSNGGEAAAALPAAYQSVGGYRDAIRVAAANGDRDPAIIYPLAFWPQVSGEAAAQGIDPLRVLALMRQESLFDPAARSPADARGLMQLLPSTAERIAHTRGEPAPADLYDPDVNVALGTAYLAQLLRQFGDPRKALAAYNGGEDAVARWQARFGPLEPDEFVESITYRETRDYVKKVEGNYRQYRLLYGQ